MLLRGQGGEEEETIKSRDHWQSHVTRYCPVTCNVIGYHGYVTWYDGLFTCNVIGYHGYVTWYDGLFTCGA